MSVARTMNWQPITLCGYSSAEINFSNRILSGLDDNLQITLQKQVCRVCLMAYGRDYQAVVVLRCRMGDGSISIYLNDDALGSLLANSVPPSSFRELPEDLQLALLSAAIFPLADVLKKQLDTVLTVEKFELLSDTAVGGLLLSILPPNATASKSALLRIDHPLPETFIEWLRSTGQKPEPKDYAWLPFPVDLQVGCALLKVSDIESLQFGDIMLMSTSYLSEGRLRVSISNHFSCLARIDGNNLTVQTQLERAMAEGSSPLEGIDETVDPATSGAPDSTASMTGDTSTGAFRTDEPAPSLDTSNLPVGVLFVAGRFNITLKELQAIQPGYVFDLKRDARREIEIRVNGAEIASGELVEVDGRTGVRIIECK